MRAVDRVSASLDAASNCRHARATSAATNSPGTLLARPPRQRPQARRPRLRPLRLRRRPRPPRRPDLGQGCAGHRLISLLTDNELSAQAAWLGEHAGGAEVVLKADSYETQHWVAAGGGGLALLPRFRADMEPALRRIRTLAPIPAAEIWLGVHAENRQLPRIRAVLDCIAEAVRARTAALNPAANLCVASPNAPRLQGRHCSRPRPGQLIEAEILAGYLRGQPGISSGRSRLEPFGVQLFQTGARAPPGQQDSATGAESLAAEQAVAKDRIIAITAAQANISKAEATQRFDTAQPKLTDTKNQAIQTAKTAADKSAAASTGSFLGAVALLLEAIAAALAGALAITRRSVVTMDRRVLC